MLSLLEDESPHLLSYLWWPRMKLLNS